MSGDEASKWQMERLWAPWRIEYIQQVRDLDCVLCTAPGRDDDEQALILHRGTWNYIIMNRYPYSPGHLMVAPYKHTADLDELAQEECLEHIEFVRLAIRFLKDAPGPASAYPHRPEMAGRRQLHACGGTHSRDVRLATLDVRKAEEGARRAPCTVLKTRRARR
jgi:hypothetical protein